MPLDTCAPQPFEGTQQFEVPVTTTIIDLVRINGKNPGEFTWSMVTCGRPVVPLWGVKLNAVTGGYDFLPSTKGNEKTLIEIAKSCLDASTNYVNDIGDPPAVNIYDTIRGDRYGSYLYRKIGNSLCKQQRYIEVYNKAVQFFSLHAAIPAFDLPLYKELTDLVSKVMRESDKQMYIAPGFYTFLTGSTANTALEAWHTADPTFEKLFGLELVTT